MNEGIIEHFGRSKRGFKRQTEEVHVWIQPQQLNAKVRQYYDDAKKPVDGGPWLDRPELPSANEVLDLDAGGSTTSSEVEMMPNRPKGPWTSKEEYLGAHYELLREDSVRPVRHAVSQVRFTPKANEDAFNGAIGIYEKVHICGVIASPRGVAVRVTFSLVRAGKKILWEQSKRLITGGLVVLTPANDMFTSKAIVAVVAGRGLEGLRLNPPEIELFIARPEEYDIDPAAEFVMIEDRGGLYEADRHTLLALQKMMREPFPLKEHLVKVTTTVSAPKYVKEKPLTDLTSALINNKHETYENVHILDDWPSHPHSDLDASQLLALHRILSKRLAIVQGPPGTGKTHISAAAIKIMLANRKSDDPPIIIACQTNHAIDQILLKIAEFEPDFIRLGGRSKDRDVIKARTLYEVRKLTSENPLAGSLRPHARKKMKELEKQIELCLLPLKPDKSPLEYRHLQKLGIISEKQADSLEAGASQWVQDTLTNPKEAKSPFFVWISKKELIPVPPKPQPEEFGFDFEEVDLEFEQLRDMEAETVAKDDEDFDELKGTAYPIADNFTCRSKIGMTDTKLMDALKQQDMWKIPEAVRPAVYRYLQTEMKKKVLAEFRDLVKQYNEQAIKRRIGYFEQDETHLKKQKVIGMTTTGLSKYRGLISALEPKIVLIEEAAETLEAPVTVACMPSLQHLILVGDHKQLRPHTHVKAHEDKPFYLNVSLFERLVGNKVEFETLVKQRRMIPEIRRILYPIYKNIIKDHNSVLNRKDIPGMGGVNSFFFTHQWPEQRDEQMSAYNMKEASMIVGFAEYLVYNGFKAEDITVLTFYNGQRKKILSGLRQNAQMAGMRNRVVTVDSYQGEENEVVILSLVRSNDKGQIGFLNIDNRVCVALSRAKRGFYIFGNGLLIYHAHSTWKKVLNIMANEGPKADRLKVEPTCRLDETFAIRCSNHNNLTEIKAPEDWEQLSGGCKVEKCGGTMPCGHPCQLLCHPMSHDSLVCQQPCGKVLSCCGAKCEAMCGEACVCNNCSKGRGVVKMSDITNPVEAAEFDRKETLSQHSHSDSWMSFSENEPVKYAAAASAPVSLRSSPEKAELLDLGVEKGVGGLSLGLDGTASRPNSTSPSKEKGSWNGKRKKWNEKIVVGATAGAVVSARSKDWTKEDSLLD